MRWLADLRRKWWRSRGEGFGETFVAEVKWERTEELRPDRLGLTDGDEELREFPRDPWRPKRTLGPY